MSVRIGHASLGSNGLARGDAPGDQNGQEVYIRDWYNKGWTVVLRPKSAAIAEKSAQACEKGCANQNLGYDQNSRNGAHDQAKKVGYDLSKITTPCNTDCSAFMTLCVIAGGVTALEYTGNAPTTSTMQAAFLKTGQYTALTDSRYLTSDLYLKRGDILLKPGSHTAMALSNGANVATAYPMKGIDISLYQDPAKINYNALANHGVRFVVIKALGKNNVTDRHFEAHYKNLFNLGIPIYVYTYSYARNADDAAAEAKALIALLAGRKIEGVFLDVEDGALQGLKEQLVHNINTYCSIVQSAGYRVGVYSGMSFIKDKILPYKDLMVCKQLWIARYPHTRSIDFSESPDETRKPSFDEFEVVGWQYSSNTHIPEAYNNRLDANIFYSALGQNKIIATSTVVKTGTITANTLRVRTKPVDGGVVEYLGKDTKVYIYQTDPATGWHKISATREMWIGNNFVTIQ